MLNFKSKSEIGIKKKNQLDKNTNLTLLKKKKKLSIFTFISVKLYKY